MKTVAELWNAYRTQVMPPEAGPNQIIETRRAFYAAVALTIELIERIGDSVPDTDAGLEDGATKIEALQAECQRFITSVRQGTM